MTQPLPDPAGPSVASADGAGATSVDAANPWPGLASFTEDARGFFFGRERETDELSRLVRRQTLTVLFGQSGLGKSSLIQAGLFPLLRDADFLPLYLRLDHDPAAADLTAQVKAALVAAFQREKADAPVPSADETLWEYFHRKDIDIWSAKNRLLTPVLAFDQFEEVFTLGRAGDRARDRSRRFLTELACLVENRAPPAVQAKLDRGELDPLRFNFQKPSCQVILSLREDFLPDLEGLKQEMPALIHNRLRLKKLSGTQALEIVSRPAPHLVAGGVGEKIVEFVAGARGGSAERLAELDVEPPLLSVICRELNDRRRALGQAQITADLVSGNRREILHDFYERSVADLPEAMRTFVEDHLLTKSGFRDNLALETALEQPGVTRELVDTLVQRRLLRLEDRLGVQRVELTHDVLADVVRASRDMRQQRRAADIASRASRRQRLAIGGLAAVVVALLIGAFFGLRAQRQAERRAAAEAAQSSRTDTVFGSRLLDEARLAEGLAYLVRAGRKDPLNPVIAPRLLTALAQHNFALPFGAPLALPSPTLWVEMSGDGRRLFTQGEDQVVRIIDLVDWRVERELSFSQPVARAGIFLPRENPALFAALLVDGSLVICDSASGQPRTAATIRPPETLRRRRDLRLSPDGRWLMVQDDTNVSVSEVSSGELKVSLPNDAGYYRDFDVSRDGRRIVTTHGTPRVVQIWSLPEGKPIGPEIRAAYYVFRTRFSDDGRRFVVWNSEGASVFDTETGEPVSKVIALNAYGTSNVFLTPDGTRVLQSASDRTVNVFDVTTGNRIFSLAHGGLVLSGTFTNDGKRLFTNCVDGLFRLWDLETGQLVAEPTWKQNEFTPAVCTPDGSSMAVFSRHGAAYRLRLGRGPLQPLVLPRTQATTLFVNLAHRPPARLMWLLPDAVKVIDIASGQITAGGFKFPTPIPGNNGSVRSGYGDTLEPGQVLIPRMPDRSFRAWTWGENGIAHDVPMQDTSARVTSWGLNERGVLATNVAGAAPRLLGIWNTRTGARIATLDVGSAWTEARLSEDETLLGVRTTDSVIHIYNVATRKELTKLELTGRSQLAGFRFLPGNVHILTGDSWGGVHVWEAGTGKQVQSRSVHRTTVTRFEFSSNGTQYASLSTDGSVQVWNARTHEPVGELMSLAGRAARATFSPNGTQLGTPTSGETARIWDIQSGLPLNDPMLHPGQTVSIVAFSPDGAFVSATTDTNAAGLRYNYLWPAPPDGRGAPTPRWLLQLATIAAGRRLTDEGKFVVALEEFSQIEAIRRQIAALPASDDYATWARWLLAEGANRPIAPRFTITPAEAERVRDEFLRATKVDGGAATSAP